MDLPDFVTRLAALSWTFSPLAMAFLSDVADSSMGWPLVSTNLNTDRQSSPTASSLLQPVIVAAPGLNS
jgi:hypothetical protein